MKNIKKISAEIWQAYRMNETSCVTALIKHAKLSPDINKKITQRAEALVTKIREEQKKFPGVETFLAEYRLSSEEGIALMCLAEALLRIPDDQTVDLLIKDKLAGADWRLHLGHSDSLFVNASTWGLMLSGNLLQTSAKSNKSFGDTLKKFFKRVEEPIIRAVLKQAMKIMARQFVMGETLDSAIKHASKLEAKGDCYSYDMLGESAHTQEEAEHYFQTYLHAIEILRKHNSVSRSKSAISVKLSALHPRYEYMQRTRVINELIPRVLHLAQQAKVANIDLTLDAEEANRFALMLEVFSAVFADDSLQGWEGFGLVLQAYQKQAWTSIDWLAELSCQMKRRIKIRLVKGAYWDSEIKESQILGLENYPVFTRKVSTDISYQACAKKLLSLSNCFYPQFATHNAHTVAMIQELAGGKEFELQRLHGMGEALYENIPCRIYAPVGHFKDLLPYLVRRMLENGANISFVSRVIDKQVPIAELITDPIAKITEFSQIPHPNIPLPSDIFPNGRKNSRGIDLANEFEQAKLSHAMNEIISKHWLAAPIVCGKEHYQRGVEVYSPADKQQIIGHVQTATEVNIEQALTASASAFDGWNATPVIERARCLEKAAELFEKHRYDLITLAIYEGGKTIADAIAEVREAIDYCRYYAQQAVLLQAEPIKLQGYTGEMNELQLHGRGVMVCISPWNFPLAIFVGQITACLVTGNTVLAKPAKQTPLIAALAVRLLHAAGIPDNALHFLPASAELISQQVLPDPRVAGVLLTGSVVTAHTINRILATRPGPIIPFIAETGGLNAMIVDSSAYIDQVVRDAVTSAFGSAGQRCSALRVLFVQKEIAEPLMHKLKGVVAELKVGDPGLLATDMGPVIDDSAKNKLEIHAEKMTKEGKFICQANLMPETNKGYFFAPRVYQIENLQQLKEEVFGPILHLIIYERDQLNDVIEQINQSGYGLTLGIQSRITETIELIQKRVRVGNCYVNRNMIGAVVGVQPFGGEGLSGTGPKAGGPHYLTRLCHERTLTVNTTVIGGNTSLISLEE